MRQIRATVEVLDQSEVLAIHAASQRLLARTGARIAHQPTLERCRDLGCTVQDDVLRIPEAMLDDFVTRCRNRDICPSTAVQASAPGSATGSLASSPVAAVPLTMQPVFGNISTQVFCVDYITRKRRYGTRQDLRQGIRLASQLVNFPRANAIVVPHDVPAAISDVVSYADLFTYSAKPGGTYILTPASARAILAMARLVGQPVDYLFETISPLAFRRETLEIAWLFAAAGQSISIAPMINACSTAPGSLAGALLLQNAEVLLSLFLVEAISGKIPDYVAGSHTTDVRSMLCSFGSPNQALLGIGTAQLARFYGLPSGSNSGLSDAWLPDFQCGSEKTLSAVLACAAGTRAIGGQGIVGADQGISLEQLVIDDAWLSATNHVIRGLTVDTDSLALDLIETVGIGGNFLAEEHTVHWMSETNFQAELFPRLPWQDGGGAGLIERAQALVRRLLADASPLEPVLSDALARDLARLGCEAAAEAQVIWPEDPMPAAV